MVSSIRFNSICGKERGYLIREIMKSRFLAVSRTSARCTKDGAMINLFVRSKGNVHIWEGTWIFVHLSIKKKKQKNKR